jgi:hypothetical protein
MARKLGMTYKIKKNKEKYRISIQRGKGKYAIQPKNISSYLKYKQELKIKAKNPDDAIEKYRKKQKWKGIPEIVRIKNKHGKVLKQKSFSTQPLTSYRW